MVFGTYRPYWLKAEFIHGEASGGGVSTTTLWVYPIEVFQGYP
jgi:hypothetical protein